MKTNLFLIAALCSIVAPNIVCMEEGVVYRQPKSLVETIVAKKLSEYEDRLVGAKNADERNTIMAEYQNFFDTIECGHEAIEETRKEILTNGIPQESKAVAFDSISLTSRHDQEDWLDLEIIDTLTHKTIQYVNVAHDPCSIYDIRYGTISPDGKFIAILLQEPNERYFVALYKNAPSGTLEYIGALPRKITDSADISFNNTINGFLFLNTLSAHEKPYKVPQLTVQKTSSFEEARKWSIWRSRVSGMAVGLTIGAAVVKTGLDNIVIGAAKSAISQLSNLFKK